MSLGITRRVEIGRLPDGDAAVRCDTSLCRLDRILAREAGEPSPFAMLQLSVPNEGNGWKWTLEELERYYENCASVAFPSRRLTPGQIPTSSNSLSSRFRSWHATTLAFLSTQPRLWGAVRPGCTAPSASGSADPAFSPEPITSEYLRGLMTDFKERATEAFDALKEQRVEIAR